MIKILRSILNSKILAIIWTATIFILCTLPSEEVAKIGSMNDKLNHVIAFSVFIFLWLFQTSLTRLIILIGIFYGVLIEIWQHLLPEHFHRGFELLDTVADAIGCLIGYFIYLLFNKIVNLIEHK
jgi:VanZ family protein